MNFNITSYLLGLQKKIATSESDLSDSTATRADILYPKTAYLSNGLKGTGTIQSIEAATYTPTTSNQTIASGKYLAGDQTILGDANLIADNIKKNISIFGVVGTYTPEIDPEKTVQFIDYDGSILYSYTPAQFAALESLPPFPSVTGLIAQGWNWTLADAKAHVAAYGSLKIGQMYATASGATEIDITLVAPNLSPYLIVTLSGPITINWGDGSASETASSAVGQVAIQHVYSTAGNYTITLSSENQNITFSGDYYSPFAGVLFPTSSPSKSTLYSSTIQAIRLGENAIIGIDAFASCTQLKTITIPQGITTIEKIAFYHCFALKSIVIPNTVSKLDTGSFSGCASLEKISIPKSVTIIEGETFNSCKQLSTIDITTSITDIKEQAFNNCVSIKEIAIPNSVTNLEDRVLANCSLLSSADLQYNGTIVPNNLFASCGNLVSVSLPNTIKYIRDNAFSGCTSLQSISLPSSVTEINSNAFANCFSLSVIQFLSQTPPTITSSTAFNGIPTNCIIYVPAGKLSAYTSATNYPSSTTYTYMEAES